MDLVSGVLAKPQSINKVTKLISPGNKLVPLHGSKIKANERKRHIINMCGALKMLKDKCGINSIKEIPLAANRSKTTSNQGTNIILVLSYEGGCKDSDTRSQNFARVVKS